MSAACQSRLAPIITEGGRHNSSANDIHRTAKEIKSAARRYPYERTWSVATYLSPIAVMSRTASIVAPLDSHDRNLPLVA